MLMSEARLLRRLRYLSKRVASDVESANQGLAEYLLLLKEYVVEVE